MAAPHVAGVFLLGNASTNGFAVGEVLYPYYGPLLVVVTAAILLTITAAVSYLPARRILGYRATDALRGKML